jgi:hypothetical protein
MIERVELKTSTAEVQPIQSTDVQQVRREDHSASSHNEVLIHNTSLLGDHHWNGTMNAFRVATAFEAQQQLLSMKDGDRLSDPKVELNAQSPSGVAVPHQPTEPNTVRPVIGLDEEQNNTTALRGQSLPGTSRFQSQSSTVESAEVVMPFAAADGVAYTPRDGSKPKVRNRQDTNQLVENGRGRTIFRGRLIRVGNTSQFVEQLSS